MGRDGEERKFFFHIERFEIFSSKSEKMVYPAFFLTFLCIKEGGAKENLNFSLLSGSNFVSGRETMFWGGQPMGIPPRTPPLAHVWQKGEAKNENEIASHYSSLKRESFPLPPWLCTR